MSKFSSTLMVLFAAGSSVSAQQLDTARALSAIRDARTVCAADAGGLWRHSLCGPVVIADRQTRLSIASDSIRQRRYFSFADAFITTLPESQFIANTSFTWAGDGRAWTLLGLPLPADRYRRVALLMHESFHREQKALGFETLDALNNHLDFRSGRTWLRMEYRALAAALNVSDINAMRRHVESALLFRAARRSLYPLADSTERLLEIHEGLAEYTGQRLAMTFTGETRARVAQHVLDIEKGQQTFVRSFAYGTGPALGVLLDTFSPAWRDSVLARHGGDLSRLLAASIAWRAPPNLIQTATKRGVEYGWAEVDGSEAARDSMRAPTMRAYRARFTDAPTISLQQTRDSLSWGYDPTALIALDERSLIYPWGSFTAPWGNLQVDSLGVFVANDLSVIRVGVPSGLKAGVAGRLSGNGWTLTLNPGWIIVADPERPGSFSVRRGS